MHTNTEICDGQKAKPRIINFYNKNKVGVDVFDQMSRFHSCHSASRRWPLAVWANILDISTINANVVFTKSMQRSMSPRKFLLQLIEELVGLRSPVAITASSSNVSSPSTPVSRKRRKCRIQQCSNITLSNCESCSRPNCGSCAKPNSKVTYVTCKSC